MLSDILSGILSGTLSGICSGPQIPMWVWVNMWASPQIWILTRNTPVFDAFDGHKNGPTALPVASAAWFAANSWEFPRFGQWNGKHRSKWHQSEARLGMHMRRLSSSLQKRGNNVASRKSRISVSKSITVSIFVKSLTSRDFQHTKRGCDAPPRCSVAERAVAPSDPEVCPASAALARYGTAVEHSNGHF